MPRTCVDRGGTFTDVVVHHDDGTTSVRKVRSDAAVVGRLKQGTLTFGTTVATNALLEGRGVPTLLVVTRGFADLATIGDMTRPALFDPHEVWPDPLCTEVLEVQGRIGSDGTVVAPLVLPPPPDLSGIAAVAVVLLNSPRHPDHERRIAAWLKGLQPALFVSLGHEIHPEVGYLSRIETTLVDAAITPVLRAALVRDEIRDRDQAMRSDGTWVPAGDLRAPDAVLSGPAGGVVAVAAVARQGGVARAVGLDMGGTSTDVCLVGPGGLPRRGREDRIGGVRVRRPSLEVETIAAGGGSVLWHDGVRLGVGPHSAGADPGPQCYGRGGPPTLTDAALVCGLVDPAAFTPPLDPEAVDLPAAAEDFLDIARQEMAAAIHRVARRRGLDVQDHALVPFGGAAGQHAAAIADALGMDLVLIHPCAAVLSAWGQALAPRGDHRLKALWIPLTQAETPIAAAEEALTRDLGAFDHTATTLDVAHTGTDGAIEVPAHPHRGIRDAFERAHRDRYGFDRDLPLTVVNVRVRGWDDPADPPPAPDDPFGLGAGIRAGPVRLDAPTTSVWVPAGWRARHHAGLIRLERDRPRSAADPDPTKATAAARSKSVADPHGVSVWGSRFQRVATEAGVVLQRTARSVNIRERLDFSCAVFDPGGQLVANAPHIPVHLGAMGATVRDLLSRVDDLPAGQHWLSNDPAAGGSHLPDLTVVHPVSWDGRRCFVACRGHHVDVGGLTPGSMPPRSRRLRDEGVVVRNLPLLRGGRLRPDLAEHLQGCRDPSTLAADLQAQIAANTVAARLLVALGSAEGVVGWMAHLQDAAAASVQPVIDNLGPPATAKDTIGGIGLQVTLSRDGGRLLVDFTGTGGPAPGNLNAPSAVVRAAVLYALRVLAGRDIPLNEGVMRNVVVRCPPNSLVDPPPDAAVAGGNVETSQRIVDLILRATQTMAGSAGTMSNTTLGGDGWSLYETVGGGQGASARGPGPSGRQIHMTNTRATDPEVLEARLPVRIRRFALRQGSGGPGEHPGGEGLVREIEVCVPATAALLATRRGDGAPGLAGGGPGRPGADRVRREGEEALWAGDPIDLAPGDRITVVTPGGGGFGTGDTLGPRTEDP